MLMDVGWKEGSGRAPESGRRKRKKWVSLTVVRKTWERAGLGRHQEFWSGDVKLVTARCGSSDLSSQLLGRLRQRIAWTWEAEVAAGQDRATAPLHLGQQSETPSQKNPENWVLCLLMSCNNSLFLICLLLKHTFSPNLWLAFSFLKFCFLKYTFKFWWNPDYQGFFLLLQNCVFVS